MVWITCMYLTAYQLRIVELLKCVNTDWHFPPVTDLQWTFAVFMKCKCDLSFISNVFMDIISNPTIHKSRRAKCSIQHLHIITLPNFFFIYIYENVFILVLFECPCFVSIPFSSTSVFSDCPAVIRSDSDNSLQYLFCMLSCFESDVKPWLYITNCWLKKINK